MMISGTMAGLKRLSTAWTTIGIPGNSTVKCLTIRYRASNVHDTFVELTDVEFDAAMQHGRDMYASSQKRHLKDYRTFVRNGVDGERVQCLGSIAEHAAAKAIGIPWTRWVDTFKNPDLDGNIEVRLIGVDHYGLRVYPNDDESRRVVGVVIRKGEERSRYRIPGWILAGDAKRKEWMIDPLDRKRPVYAVPQSELLPLAKLIHIIKLELSPPASPPPVTIAGLQKGLFE